MNLFDIIGPVMVGPSSSHTAGAVKIGYVARKLMAEPVRKAEILLYGSFLATGKGHGTDCAIVAGLLGMKPDDIRIPKSMEYAKEAGMEVQFGKARLKNGHPNSAVLNLVGVSGKTLSVVGESLGGSLINIASVDGRQANFSGERPTLIVHNKDIPGRVTYITGVLSDLSINIATMQLYRTGRGGNAVMIIECDEEIPKETLDLLKQEKGVERLTYYSAKEDF
jgi:L-serine dehydratase